MKRLRRSSLGSWQASTGQPSRAERHRVRQQRADLARCTQRLPQKTQYNRSLADLRAKLVRRLVHTSSTFSGNAASDKPGAVQLGNLHRATIPLHQLLPLKPLAAAHLTQIIDQKLIPKGLIFYALTIAGLPIDSPVVVISRQLPNLLRKITARLPIGSSILLCGGFAMRLKPDGAHQSPLTRLLS